jgi:hypothetical protein
MKKVVATFGRMNPPTSGHQKLVDKINSVAKANRADARVYLSHSQNNKKDPLDYNTKINLAIKAFGSIVTKSGSKTIIQVMQELQRSGYTDVIIVVGSDRVNEFDTLLNKYNGKDYTFDSIKVVSAGQRDPDADDVSGMSASKLRGLAKEGNFAAFKAGLPRNIQRDAKKIYDQLRSIMEEEQLDEYTVLNLQQRMKRARVMKRIARKAARMRKIRAGRMADQARLTKRSRKKAIQMLRKRVAGQRGKDYKDLGRAEKITVDKLVAKRSGIIDKLAKRLLPKVRKAEVERLRAARSTKNETLTLNSYKQLVEAKQDPEIKDREGAQPAKYHSGLSKSTKEKRDAEFKKGAEKHHSDPSAYPEKHAGDTGAETKTSKHTKKYHDMFGEMMGPNERRAKYNYQRDKRDTKLSHDRRIDAARLRDARLKNRGVRVEEYELTEESKAALQKKADKSGIPYSILKKVYDRGMAAWRTGHRPGAGQEQWAYARVNSFITKGKGTWGGADSDLAAKVKKEAVGTPMSVGRAAGDQKTYTSVMETIRHEGDKWVIYSKDGSKKLGEYDTETAAKKRLRQIEFFKHQHEETELDEIGIGTIARYLGSRFRQANKVGGESLPTKKSPETYLKNIDRASNRLMKDNPVEPVKPIKEAASPAQQAAIAISMKEKGQKPKNLKEISPVTLIKYASKAATSADAARKAGDIATVAKREKGIARAMDKEVASRTAPKPSAPVTKPQPNMKPTPERRWDGSTVNLSNKGTTVSYEKYVKEDGYKWADFSDAERATIKARQDAIGGSRVNKTPQAFDSASLENRKKLADILRAKPKPTTAADLEPQPRVTPAEIKDQPSYGVKVMNNSYIPEEFGKMLEDADRTIDRLRWADVPQMEPLKRMSNDQLKGYVRDYVSKNKDQVSKFMGAADSGMFGRAIIQKMAPNYIPATKSMTDKDWDNAWKAYDNIDPKIKSNIKKGDVSDFQEDAKEIHDKDKKRRLKDVLPKSGGGAIGTDELVKQYIKDTPYMTIEGYCPETGELKEELVIEAAEYQGKKVSLNNPFRLPAGSKKKFGVYVKNDKGNVVKVTFGDPNMEIKRDDPERRKAFRSRHSCDDDIGPKWKARYWSCYQWRAGHKVDN